MIGRVISHYRILEKLGEGGMGIVYRAIDTKLNRTVALKFLPPGLTHDTESRNRFIQEAQAASALQHNHICTVHDIDQTDDGHMFIAMDLYEGETLKKKLEKGIPLPEEALRIALQIAGGLARAHEKGIVHRDIKPANILVTEDGTVKILDFGLAKLGGGAMLTKAGTTLGTAAYMSPEQTRGEDVDPRTDIWSLGVILYQMLAGRLPFHAEHDQAIIYAIQNSDPARPLNIPEGCQEILNKALQKTPETRYQHANELIADLRRVLGVGDAGAGGNARRLGSTRRTALLYGIGAAAIALLALGIFLYRHGVDRSGITGNDAPVLRRLAVLPFANLRSNPDTDFLGFALADQIIGNLSYVKTLLVRPSTAIRKYQTGTLDLAAAGRDLNVDLVLTGNYMKEANLIRLSLELVDIHTNAIVWREAIQEEYENAFKLEDTVARRVVDGLRVQFSAEELHQMQADVPRSPLAYEYYLRGISYPVSADGNQRAVTMLRSSISLDSTYAPAFSELGYRLHQGATYTRGHPVSLREAETAYRRALSLNGSLQNAYGGLISIYTESGATDKAYETAKKALAINPMSPDAHFYLGYIFRYAGFLEKARDEMEKAVSLDPGNPKFRSIGVTYLYLGDYEKALRGLERDSASTFSLAWTASTYFQMHQFDRALPILNRVIEREPRSSFGSFCTSMKLFIEKKDQEIRERLRGEEQLTVLDGENWYDIAWSYGLLGDSDGAARLLLRAVDGGFFNYPLMLRDPVFEAVRGSAPFQRALAAARAKYEAFKEKYPELRDQK
jgi:eukaryotic-like serine/threonine-protein kinase